LTNDDFRHLARQAITNAKAHLEASTVDLSRLRYAALDARMAIEALTYERAQSYQQELPKTAYEAWQPRKLMQMLLDIDPMADKDSSLRIGIEEAPGQQASTMHDLGAEAVLNLSIIKRHYDALGSYLHIPTPKQMESEGAHDFNRLRVRMQEIVSYIDRVLKSPIFNINFGTFTSIDCERCGNVIRWRMPHDRRAFRAVCRECLAPYDVEDIGGGKVHWKPHQYEVICTNADCKAVSCLWVDKIEPGMAWKCAACEHHSQIILTTRSLPELDVRASAQATEGS
jgi:hypothetical protein